MLFMATNVPGPSTSGITPRHALHPLEERTDVDELGEGHDVVRRDDEDVAGEQRRAVEEADGDVVAGAPPRPGGAGDDGAEHAVRHRTILAAIHHPPIGGALQQTAVGHRTAEHTRPVAQFDAASGATNPSGRRHLGPDR